MSTFDVVIIAVFAVLVVLFSMRRFWRALSKELGCLHPVEGNPCSMCEEWERARDERKRNR